MVASQAQYRLSATKQPRLFALIAIAIFLLGGFGPNSLLALASVLVLLTGCLLLWRPGEAPVLFFTFAFPWLGASIAIFHANWLDLDVTAYSEFGGNIQTATVLTLFGLLALAFGMRVGAGRCRMHEFVGAREMALSQPMDRWFRLYAVALGVSFLALAWVWVVPGLSQVLIALAGLKWAFFFMLAYASFVRGGASLYFLAAFLVEIVLGISGYFADFKIPFFVTLFAAAAAGVRVSLRAMIGMGVLGAMLVVFGIVWTAVKFEYREFVAGGQSAQALNVDIVTRLNKIAELVTELDGEKFGDGADKMLRRLSYVNFFGVVLDYVPALIPHQNGAILLDAVTRPFTPRIFFPNKTVIDDTERTNIYTGGLAGNYEATSVGLGYVAECYIDFGAWEMMIALFLIGYFYGKIYSHFVRSRAASNLLGIATASAILVGVGTLENSITKVFGGVTASVLVAWLMIWFVIPRWCPWLVGGRPS
jgi:hypothetical protein